MTGRRRLLSCLAALALLGPGAPARAIPFEATLRFDVTHTSGGPIFTGSGSGASAAGGVALPADFVQGTGSADGSRVFSQPISVVALRVLGNGPGQLSGSPLAGAMRLSGAVRFKVPGGGGPVTLLQVPLFTSHTTASAAGDVGLGVGGRYYMTIGAVAPGFLEAVHARWTAGMKTLTGLAPGNGTAMYTGTDSRTPGGLGQLTLVSPTRVTLGFEGYGSFSEVILGTLTLSFVPEPATLLLLGSGVAFLAFLGRRRRR